MNRKEWLKTDAGKQYKAKTNKNYRQNKKSPPMCAKDRNSLAYIQAGTWRYT